VTLEGRKGIALVVFALDTLVCGMWAYRAATSMLQSLSGAGGGGIAGVGVGLFGLIFTVVPPVITIWLARASGSTRLATRWRNVHLVAMLAMAILPVMGSMRVMLVSIVVFLPMQVYFVVGALAIWIASPGKRPDPSSATAS
jgi:hypothetical protein